MVKMASFSQLKHRHTSTHTEILVQIFRLSRQKFEKRKRFCSRLNSRTTATIQILHRTEVAAKGENEKDEPRLLFQENLLFFLIRPPFCMNR